MKAVQSKKRILLIVLVTLVAALCIPSVEVMAAGQAPTPDWKGKYFANRNLEGKPVLVRNDAKINFDWGTASPGAGVPADNFSVQWTRWVEFKEGRYRFCAKADDGVRVELDDKKPFIREWHDGVGTYCQEVQVSAGVHKVRVEYFEHSGGALIQLGWEKVDSYSDWKGEYFTNPSLSGNPALVRNDKALDFNWGASAPASGLPADNFSVRWTRKLHFPAGLYRFYGEVDDGIRLWVAGRLIVDQWYDGHGSYSADLYLAEGMHAVRLEMYERSGNALVRLQWAAQAGPTTWNGKYFANPKLEGKPVLVRNDAKVDFDWGTASPGAGVPADNFSVKWTRWVEFKEGRYRFCVKADDGVRVELDDEKPFIREWHDGVGTYCREVQVSAGVHKVRVEYFEHSGGALIQLGWQKLK